MANESDNQRKVKYYKQTTVPPSFKCKSDYNSLWFGDSLPLATCAQFIPLKILITYLTFSWCRRQWSKLVHRLCCSKLVPWLTQAFRFPLHVSMFLLNDIINVGFSLWSDCFCLPLLANRTHICATENKFTHILSHTCTSRKVCCWHRYNEIRCKHILSTTNKNHQKWVEAFCD